MDVDLRRRESDAVGDVHGFDHVVDEAADAVVDARYRFGHRMQARIGVTQDVEQGHRVAGVVQCGAQSCVDTVEDLQRTGVAQAITKWCRAATFVAISRV
jgi:hypothetical protein